MKCVSAYDFNDKLFEGKVYTNKNGESFIINKFGESLSTKNIKTYRLYEELEDDQVQDVVEKELNELNINDNSKLKDLSPEELEKTAEKREAELKAEGMDISDGDYKDKFVASVNAANAMDGVSAGTTSDSEAFKNVMGESKDVYSLINKEIDKYTESTTIFDESKLLEHLCNVFHTKQSDIKGSTISESVKNLAKKLK